MIPSASRGRFLKGNSLTASSSPVTAEALLEVLEQERRYYEALRALAKDQRAALYGGSMADSAGLIAKEEPQVFRAAETTESRISQEAAYQGPSAPLAEARAEAIRSLRLFSAANKQNLKIAKDRLDEIHISLGALNATEERPSYPGSASAAPAAGPSYLDRKV